MNGVLRLKGRVARAKKILKDDLDPGQLFYVSWATGGFFEDHPVRYPAGLFFMCLERGRCVGGQLRSRVRRREGGENGDAVGWPRLVDAAKDMAALAPRRRLSTGRCKIL